MQPCDIYYNNPPTPYMDRIYYAACDLAQIGGLSTDYAPDVEREKCENGSYATYTRGKVEISTTLQFECRCDQIKSISEALANGEICIGNAMVDGVNIGTWKGILCYTDGDPNITVISPANIADIVSVSIPVIVRETIDVPAMRIELNDVPGVYFGNISGMADTDPTHFIALSECRYEGNGVYVCDRLLTYIQASEDAGGIYLCGEMIDKYGYTPSPNFYIRSNDETDYTLKALWLETEIPASRWYDIPVGDSDIKIVIENTSGSFKFKRFELRFSVRRYS